LPSLPSKLPPPPPLKDLPPAPSIPSNIPSLKQPVVAPLPPPNSINKTDHTSLPYDSNIEPTRTISSMPLPWIPAILIPPSKIVTQAPIDPPPPINTLNMEVP
jgi:hypothetical protein